MAIHDQELHKRIQAKWGQYKDKTKTSQARAGKLMGMNQSAFGQYIRGDIPLNVEFLQKFEKLVGEPLQTNTNWATRNVHVTTLAVKGTLSGNKPNINSVTVQLGLDKNTHFLIEIDFLSHYLPLGSYVVITDDIIKNHSTAVLHTDGKYVLGHVTRNNEDWVLIESHFFGSRSYAVDENSELYRVVATVFPEPKGARLK